jgi:hypothetical protein
MVFSGVEDVSLGRDMAKLHAQRHHGRSQVLNDQLMGDGAAEPRHEI